MRKVLITGANSYIGTSFEKYVKENNVDFEIDTLDLLNPNWQEFDFSGYDSIFHVAGIAHFSKDESKKDLYYKVNTELTEKVALIAKQAGVNQFVFMSSIIVYGDSTSSERIITKDTKPSPSDFYGDSKWQAEQRLEKLIEPDFNIVIIRPPMIYGEGAKGNYPRLAKLAKTLPLFPLIDNQRSMLYIGNFCCFLVEIIRRESKGIFFPQNKLYVNTSTLVKTISEVHNKRIFLTRIFNPIINRLYRFDTIKKLFGNIIYERDMSKYEFEYQIYNFEQSIYQTERK